MQYRAYRSLRSMWTTFLSIFRLQCTLIRSEVAGVGKSHKHKTLCRQLRVNFPLGRDITLPIHKHVETDHIVDTLLTKLDDAFNNNVRHTIHIDIANEVSKFAIQDDLMKSVAFWATGLNNF